LSKLRAKLASCAVVASREVNLTAPRGASSSLNDLKELYVELHIASREASSKKLYVKLAKLALSEAKPNPPRFF